MLIEQLQKWKKQMLLNLNTSNVNVNQYISMNQHAFYINLNTSNVNVNHFQIIINYGGSINLNTSNVNVNLGINVGKFSAIPI